MKNRLFLLGALCGWCTTTLNAGTLETIEIEVGNDERHFTLFTPSSYDPEVPTPLVFGIHGYTSSAEEHQLVTNLDQVAEDRGVLVVYPQAINNDWFPGHVPANNLDYLMKVYDETVAVRNVNKEIVGLSGLSQGAAMSMTLAAAEPSRFSSIVTVAGSRFFTEDDVPVPSNVPEVPDQLISRLHVHGTGDLLARIDGGQILDFPLYNHTIIDSVTTWAEGLGSELEPTLSPIDDEVDDGLKSEVLVFQGRSYHDIDGVERRAETKYVRVLGGGHNWPGDFEGWPELFQPVAMDFSTSEMAVDFILEHPREYLLGDFTRDGSLNALDIDLLSAAVQESSADTVFDLDSDGGVTNRDRDFMISDVVGTLKGDFDLNKVVQFDDFLRLAANFGDEGGWSDGDSDGNGIVEFPDFLALASNFGLTTATNQIASVPEPSSSMVLTVSLAITSFFRRRTAGINITRLFVR